MNKITNKGTPKKTLNIVMAGTGIGKTIFLCHHAAACLSAGLDVLYITLEMSEEEISKRIDANLLNVSMDDLLLIPKADYDRRMSKLKSHNAEVGGKLIVKEYPTASASVTNFRHLLNELKLKKNFKPAIIFVDYLNICTSSRIKAGSNVNSYTYVKSIAEELRGLAVEYDVPVWSATQLNRSGYADSDPEMDQTSESFGLPMTVDFLMILVSSEELESLNQLMVKQVKNRYRDVNKDKRFVIGLDKDKMRFHDVAASEQNLAVKKGESAEETPWEVPKSGSRKPKLVEGVKY
jgi:replicative DNA helicase